MGPKRRANSITPSAAKRQKQDTVFLECGCRPDWMDYFNPNFKCGHRTLLLTLRHFLGDSIDQEVQNYKFVDDLLAESSTLGGVVYLKQIQTALEKALGPLYVIEDYTEKGIEEDGKAEGKCKTPKRKKKVSIADATIDLAKELESKSSEEEMRTFINSIPSFESATVTVKIESKLAKILPIKDTVRGALAIVFVDSRFLPYETDEHKKCRKFRGHFIVLHSFCPENNLFKVRDPSSHVFHILTPEELECARHKTRIANNCATPVLIVRAGPEVKQTLLQVAVGDKIDYMNSAWYVGTVIAKDKTNVRIAYENMISEWISLYSYNIQPFRSHIRESSKTQFPEPAAVTQPNEQKQIPKNIREWKVSDVCQWLQTIAPTYQELYSKAITENAFNGSALLMMDIATLKALGVTNVAHQTRILAGVYDLRDSVGLGSVLSAAKSVPMDTEE
jgi:hypothetical protein